MMIHDAGNDKAVTKMIKASHLTTPCCRRYLGPRTSFLF